MVRICASFLAGAGGFGGALVVLGPDGGDDFAFVVFAGGLVRRGLDLDAGVALVLVIGGFHGYRRLF